MCLENVANLLTIIVLKKNILPYSGYKLRGAISANHQISHLEVIFAIVKFANHSMVCVARSSYAPAAY